MTGWFAGDVLPVAAWQGLVADPDAMLVDVRTQAEWTYVGVPDLSSLRRPLIQVEWQHFPSGNRNPRFAEQLAAHGIRSNNPLYLICRSGVRSKAAGELLAGLGYTSYNVAYGFEGQPDGQGHRGTVNGWKVDGLPWRQG